MTTTELKISSWRTYECVNRVEECAGVDSYYLLAKDGKPMEGLLPGQYVYVKANFPSTGEFGPASFPVSSAPDAGLLRLTVKYVSGRNQVEPGCEIVVPNKKKKNGVLLSNILGYATSFASLGTMAASIANLVK